MNGEARQQKQDNNRKLKAVFLMVNFCERNPPKTQEKLPIAIIEKDKIGILKTI